MTIFRTVYAYVFEQQRSRFYATVRAVVRVAMQKVDYKWAAYYRVGLEGESLGVKRTKGEAAKRARGLLKSKPVGTSVIVRAYHKTDEVIGAVKIRKATKKPVVPNGRGVEGIDRFEWFVKVNFPKARFAGDCVCKTTVSGGHSDHADCAAVDYFDTWANMSAMRDAAFRYQDWFHTKYAILGDRIYFPSGTGSRSEHYSGVYHPHLHLSVNGGVYRSAC
jgi:hypothetical protein